MKDLGKKEKFLVALIFTCLSFFIFRNYFLKGQVPLPANLLVSFYSPWKYYPQAGYPNGPANKPIGFDVIRYFYPYRQFTTDQLKAGLWPLWNPYNFAGNVHLAAYQTAVFYPLNILYFLLPQVDAWSWLVILQPILAGLFMYLFLKEINLSSKGSFLGALAFAFSGWMMSWSEESLVIEHAALWLPLILYALERVGRKAPTGNSFLLVLGLTCSILAGFLQMTIYVFAAAFGWSLFRKKTFVFLAAATTSLLISAVHWLPAMEAYFQSPRAVADVKFLFESYLLSPWHLVGFLAPDFWGNPGAYNYFGGGFYHEKVIYIGIPALLLAMSAFFVNPGRRILKFWRWFSLITLALGFFPLGWLLYLSRLPLLSTMMPTRIFFLSTFGLCVLAAFGWDFLAAHKISGRWWLKIFLLLPAALLALVALIVFRKIYSPTEIMIIGRNLILPAGIFLATILAGRRRFYLGLVGLAILSSSYFANKFFYFSERQFIFPQTAVITELHQRAGLDRVWSYGNGYWEKNFNIFYGLYSPEGYDGLFPRRYGELLHGQENAGQISAQLPRSDAGIATASERDGVLDNDRRARLLALLGVKYITEAKVGEGKDWLILEKRFPEKSFKLAWEDDQFRIWEFLAALPRAFLVHDYVVENNGQKIADRLFDPHFDLRKTVVLEKEPGYRPVPGLSPGEAQIVKYEPNRVEIKTNSPAAALLFLSDNDYPGWQAEVDGQSTEILRADYTFRAVALPAGEHQIIFSYRPAFFNWGLKISGAAIVLWLIWLAWRKKSAA